TVNLWNLGQIILQVGYIIANTLNSSFASILEDFDTILNNSQVTFYSFNQALFSDVSSNAGMKMICRLIESFSFAVTLVLLLFVSLLWLKQSSTRDTRRKTTLWKYF